MSRPRGPLTSGMRCVLSPNTVKQRKRLLPSDDVSDVSRDQLHKPITYQFTRITILSMKGMLDNKMNYIYCLSQIFFLRVIFLPSGQNYCTVNNGGCTHLCLATPVGRSCMCPKNTVGVSCVEREGRYWGTRVKSSEWPQMSYLMLSQAATCSKL